MQPHTGDNKSSVMLSVKKSAAQSFKTCCSFTSVLHDEGMCGMYAGSSRMLGMLSRGNGAVCGGAVLEGYYADCCLFECLTERSQLTMQLPQL